MLQHFLKVLVGDILQLMESSSEKDKKAFERFLTALSSDKDQSADVYHELRRKLVRYCALRGIFHAEEAADEVLDRVINKDQEWPSIVDITRYSYGVARLVVLERIRKQKAESEALNAFKRNPGIKDSDGDDLLMEYLMECLKELEEGNRGLILEYFSSGRKDFQLRESIAEKNGITLNKLRLKIFRLKRALEKCVEGKKF